MHNDNDVFLIAMAFKIRCTIRELNCEQIIFSLYMQNETVLVSISQYANTFRY